MLTAFTAALLLAAPVTDRDNRFSAMQVDEARRIVLAALDTSLDQVRGLYNWASSSVTLDRYIAQQKALDISRSIRSTEAEWSRMIAAMPAAQAGKVNPEVTTMRDLFAKMQVNATKLSTTAGSAAPDRVDVRLITSDLYRALMLAHDHQMVIGKNLGWNSGQPTTDRAR